MPIKLQVRRGTAAQWAQVGVGDVVVLLNGEIGFETDTGNIKIGDGSLVWNNLPYQFPFVKNARGLDTTTLVIDQTTDFVGIGTNSPASKLHVEGTAPIVRLRDSAAPGTTHVLLDADNSDGSLTISADPGATGTAASKINLATDGTTRATIDENGRLGIGTTAPTAAVHISTAAPIVRLTDTGAATAYSEISQDNTNGTLVISADETAAALGSTLNLRTDGANRVIIDNTGMTVIPPINPSGGFVSGTIATAALANDAVTKTKMSVLPQLVATTYFSGSGNFVVPAKVTSIRVTAVGGGGGGASDNTATGRGGSGGSVTLIYSVTPGASYAYVVGSGGAGAASGSSNTNGTAGTATTFLSITAGGGDGETANGSNGTAGTVTVAAAPAGTSILAEYRRGLVQVPQTLRARGSGTSGVAASFGGALDPGSPGECASVNGATGASAAAGGVNGMLVIEYIDMV